MLLSVGLICGCVLVASAQPHMSYYMDLGQNNISDGLYVKSVVQGGYNFNKYQVETGFQFNLKSYNNRFFSGYYLGGGRKFLINKFEFSLQGLFVYAPYLDTFRETNWGIIFKMNRQHFRMRFGTNFRTYSITRNTSNSTVPEENIKLHENWNIMYSFSYYFMKEDRKWNIGLNITNIDYFLIYQETNPVYNVMASYRISEPLKIYLQPWYQNSGSFNLNVNYFGFFVRAGVVWSIGSKEQ